MPAAARPGRPTDGCPRRCGERVGQRHAQLLGLQLRGHEASSVGLELPPAATSNASRRVAPSSIWRSVRKTSSLAGPVSDSATRESAARYPVPARTVIERMSMKSGRSRSIRS